MDTIGFVIFIISGVAYYFTNKPDLLFISGIGAGIVLGAILTVILFL